MTHKYGPNYTQTKCPETRPKAKLSKAQARTVWGHAGSQPRPARTPQSSSSSAHSPSMHTVMAGPRLAQHNYNDHIPSFCSTVSIRNLTCPGCPSGMKHIQFPGRMTLDTKPPVEEMNYALNGHECQNPPRRRETIDYLFDIHSFFPAHECDLATGACPLDGLFSSHHCLQPGAETDSYAIWLAILAAMTFPLWNVNLQDRAAAKATKIAYYRWMSVLSQFPAWCSTIHDAMINERRKIALAIFTCAVAYSHPGETFEHIKTTAAASISDVPETQMAALIQAVKDIAYARIQQNSRVIQVALKPIFDHQLKFRVKQAELGGDLANEFIQTWVGAVHLSQAATAAQLRAEATWEDLESMGLHDFAYGMASTPEPLTLTVMATTLRPSVVIEEVSSEEEEGNDEESDEDATSSSNDDENSSGPSDPDGSDDGGDGGGGGSDDGGSTHSGGSGSGSGGGSVASGGIPAAPADHYCRAARAMKPITYEGDSRMAAKFKKFFTTPMELPSPASINPHHVSAEFRRLVAAAALARFRDRGYYDVVSVFGAERDVKMNRLFNRACTIPTKLEVYRPLVTGKDLTRWTAGHVSNLRKDADAYFINDVYQTNSASQRFDPAWIIANLAHDAQGQVNYGIQRIMWAGFYFNGTAGTICDEGAWIRSGDKVTCRSDPSNSAYVTDAVDWTHDSGCVDFNTCNPASPPGTAYLSWTVTDSWVVGTRLDLVAFSVTHDPVIAETCGAPPAQFVEVTAPIRSRLLPSVVAGLAYAVHRYAPARMVPSWMVATALVQPAMLEKARSMFQMRRVSSYSISTLEQQFKVWVAEDAACAAMMKCFPDRIGSNYDVLMSYLIADAAQRSVLLSQPLVNYNAAITEAAYNYSSLGDPSKVTNPWGDVARSAMYLACGAAIVTLFGSQIGRAAKAIVKATVMAARPATTVGDHAAIVAHKAWSAFDGAFDLGVPYGISRFACLAAYSIFLAPVAEEAVKRMIPGASWAIGVFEAVRECRQGLPLPFGIMHVLKHWSYGRAPFITGVCWHMVNNVAFFAMAACGQATAETLNHKLLWTGIVLANVGNIRVLWQAARAAAAFCRPAVAARPEVMATFYQQTLPTEQFSPNLGPDVDYEPEHSICPRRAEPSPVDIVECDVMRIPRLPHTPHPDQSQVRSFHLIFSYNVCMHVPGKTDHVALLAMRARLFRRAPMHPILQARTWVHAQQVMDQFHTGQPRGDLMVWGELVEPWLAHFTTSITRGRYKRALEQVNMHGFGICEPKFDRIQVNVKLNEALLRSEFKPRTLSNIDPFAQIMVGPMIYECTRRWKLAVNEPSKRYYVTSRQGGLWKISMRYAGADTDHDLTQWWARISQELHAGTIHIIVSGDDSLAIVTDHSGKQFIMEADASMYDQSESFGPLRQQWRMMRHFGTPDDTIEQLRRLASATLVLPLTEEKGGRSSVRLSQRERPMRQTGGSDTSLGNSYVMLMSAAYVLMHYPHDQEALEVRFQNLGLRMKIKILDSIRQATFLKGHWTVTIAGDLHWVPLPSRILKIGKTVEELQRIFPKSFRGKASANEMLTDASYKYVSEVAHGLGYFCRTPYIHHFVDAFPLKHTPRMQENPYKVIADKTVSKPSLDENEYFCFVADRYGVSECVAREALLHLPTGLFQHREHALFARFAAVDYA